MNSVGLHYFFLAAQGLHGAQAFFAAQGLQPAFLAAHGLHGAAAFLAAQGLQAAFLAAQGLQGLAAWGLHGEQAARAGTLAAAMAKGRATLAPRSVFVILRIYESLRILLGHEGRKRLFGLIAGKVTPHGVPSWVHFFICSFWTSSTYAVSAASSCESHARGLLIMGRIRQYWTIPSAVIVSILETSLAIWTLCG